MSTILNVLDKHDAYALKRDLALIRRGTSFQLGIQVDVSENFSINLLLDWAEDFTSAFGAATGQIYVSALDDVVLTSLKQLLGKSYRLKSEPGFLHALSELAAFSVAFGQSTLLDALDISQSELNDIIQNVADVADKLLSHHEPTHDLTYVHHTAYVILISCRILTN